jgi:vacuolar iron transporter family protein
VDDHFGGKTVDAHLAQVRSSQVESSLEIHGGEIPAPLFAFLDAARTSTIIMLFLLEIFFMCGFPSFKTAVLSFCCILGMSFFLASRSVILAWSRLHRLHVITAEEKKEIEVNRRQEREELQALYSSKGFSGPLLDKVVDVLMADKDRLLKVMLQEEMGFNLEESSHPLILGIFAMLGAVSSSCFLVMAQVPLLQNYVFPCAVLFIAILGTIYARFDKNALIPAFIWNFSVTVVSVISLRLLLKIFSIG